MEENVQREKEVFQSRRITIEGCIAMLRITAKDGGKWIIYGFIKEHNHGLIIPSKIPPRHSHRIAFNEACFRINFVWYGYYICISILELH